MFKSTTKVTSAIRPHILLNDTNFNCMKNADSLFSPHQWLFKQSPNGRFALVHELLPQMPLTAGKLL